MRHRVELLAPKQFVEWDTKRSAGGRYDIEYLAAVGMAATCADRLDYFTMSTPERVRALVRSGFLSAEDGTTLEQALALFTLVEHFLELQETTHPASEEKAHRVERTVSGAMTSLGLEWNDARDALTSIKERVRHCYTVKMQ
jgi:glutamine synthetase adenylyltransferase